MQADIVCFTMLTFWYVQPYIILSIISEHFGVILVLKKTEVNYKLDLKS